MRPAWLYLGFFIFALPAMAAEENAEAEIRAAVAQWYGELAKKEDGRVDRIVGQPFFEATRYYHYVDTGAASLGPRVYTSLAATALQFGYDIEAMRIDPNFARVAVWERGYFYAFAAQATYERAADTDFLLEPQEQDGHWRIVAYRSGSYGIPPGKKTDPMPDLHDLFYSTVGKDRDPDADAAAAGLDRAPQLP